MKSSLEETVQYKLPLYDVLEPKVEVDINALIGKEIQIRFLDEINCVLTGRKIKKTYGDGMSYDAWRKSPMGVPSILRPELSRIHEGIALRDEAWEREHHLAPHITYLSLTSATKVGVTRATQVPTRWIDQGAVRAIILAETPYRQAAGLVEVCLKEFVTDRTNWRTMLGNKQDNEISLLEQKQALIKRLPPELQPFVSSNDAITDIHYPVIAYPEKVKSVKLDKAPIITKKLLGVKGQYLLLEDDLVINMRSHIGYRMVISV